MNATDGELRTAVSSCETSATWGGIAVIAGVVLEIVLAAWHPPFDSFGGIWGTVIADALIALGVAAELLFSKMGSNRHGELQRRSDERVAAAQARAAEANQKAEGEALARVKLEARLADRSLLLDQAAISKGLAGTVRQRASLLASPSTPESEMFARHLGAPLKEAGWEINILPGTATATILAPTGVVVQYSVDSRKCNDFQLPRDESPSAAKLVSLLTELGIAATATPGIIDQPNTLMIVISSRA